MVLYVTQETCQELDLVPALWACPSQAAPSNPQHPALGHKVEGEDATHPADPGVMFQIVKN